MESKEEEKVSVFSLKKELGSSEEFKEYGRDFSIDEYSGQLQICRLDLVFKDDQDPKQITYSDASAFLYDTMRLNDRLFGILLTCGHAFIRPSSKFHIGYASFKLEPQREITCTFKQVFVLEELIRLEQTGSETLTSDQQKIEWGQQQAYSDYAFVTIEFTAELYKSKQDFSKIFNRLRIQKWGIGKDYDPMQIYYDKSNNFQNQERNILMVCPMKGGVPREQKDCHQTYKGYALDPKNSMSKIMASIEKQIMMYNVPTEGGHSGAVVGFECLDKENKVIFRPIGIHLGHTAVPNKTENYGRIITPDICEKGLKVREFIFKLGIYSIIELGVITFETMDDVADIYDKKIQPF